MANKFVYEQYDNIYKFMDTITSRPDNGKFSDSSMDTDDPRWSGTPNWETAMRQFENGIPEAAEKLKTSLARFKANPAFTNRVQPRNYYYGYAPNVPAAIIGLPKSMRQMQRIPHKIKTVTLISNGCVLSDVSGPDLQRHGETVLNLVYALEKSGYRVQLELLISATDCGRRGDMFCSIILKEYKQALDIMKLSFPLTSPSMFRRFGFKWKETMVGLDGNRDYSYGCSYKSPEIKRIYTANGINFDNKFIISHADSKRAGYDALKLAESLGLKI